MAGNPKTQFLTNDALTRKKWAKDLFPLILSSMELNTILGTDENAIIQRRTELAKGEGDVVKVGLVLPLAGEGVVGNNPVEGNEEKLVFKDFSVTIEELNHAVDTGGRMEEQRVPYDLMQIAKTGLQRWWSEKLNAAAWAALCGDTSFQIAGLTFAQAPTAPDSGHWLRVNDAASDAAMTSADVMDLTFLDRMKQRAEMPASGCYKVRPLGIGGKNFYRVFLHTYCFDQLRTNMNVGQWGDLQKAAGKLAVPNVEFEYNRLLVSKSENVRPSPTNGSVYRNVLLGAQAAVFAFGGAGESKSTTMAFVPYEKDAKRFVMVRGGGIFGVKKTFFTLSGADRDYGIITGSSYGAALS